MPNQETISEQIEFDYEVRGQVLEIYQKADYDPWIAVGEWVDNSVQAFKENKKALQKLYKEDGVEGLEVKIFYEAGKKFVIRDNSAGMNEEELRDAFRMGKAKKRQTDDLGQNNAGMKSAALWLGEKWEIKTKKFDNNAEYTVLVDAKKLFADDFKLSVTKRTVNDDSHYTSITISKILKKRKWGAAQQTKIKKYLASMYKYFIEDEGLNLTWNETKIEPRNLTIRKDLDGNEYKYDFAAKKGDIAKGDYLGIKGFFAILHPDSQLKADGFPLSTGTGRINAGISIYRRNRMIMGYPKAWKPDDLYGEDGSNDLFNQRVFGIIHVDDADVSQDKSAIANHDLRIIEKFLTKKIQEFDLKTKVKGFKDKKKPPTKDQLEDAKNEIVKTLQESDALDLTLNDEIPDKEILEAEKESIDQIKDEQAKKVIKVGEFTVNLYFQDIGEGKKYIVNTPTTKNDPRTINLIVNQTHPYMDQTVDLEQYFLDCVMDGIAIWKGEQINRDDGMAFAHTKDSVMRLGVEN